MSFKFFPILQTLERKAVFLREKRKRKKESFCSFRFQNAARFVFAIIVLKDLGEDYLHNGKTEVSLPLFFHIRTDILKNAKSTPYIALNAGYNFPLNKGFFRGYLVEPTIGIGFGTGKNGNQFNVGVGYQVHEVRYRAHPAGAGGYILRSKWVEKRDMHGAISIMLGFMW